MKPTEALASKTFEKQLKRLPQYIKQSALVWVASVEEEGIRAVRQIKAYRLIYGEDDSGKVTIVTILEVHKHEY